jgi:predicted ATP-grasp superfamily ATP-dependent carboligase
VLHFKLGHYPVHHASVGVIRSFGRLGVQVTSIAEDRFTPVALSRYLKRRVDWVPDAFTDPEEIRKGLIKLGQEIGDKPLIVCTDDEAAIFIAEESDVLREYFTLADVKRDLPRLVASKHGLQGLCLRHNVPTPRTTFPSTLDELEKVLAESHLPVVVKNVEPWERKTRPTVVASTVVHDPDELMQRAAGWQEPFGCLVQEYLPPEHSEDWIVQGYCGSETQIALTARKLWAWPPFTGQTAYAQLQDNPDLSKRALSFCEQIGYRGIFDLDFRMDCRDGVPYLLDFNPRIGAPFTLFQTDSSVDVARAMHLDLSGRAIPPGRQRNGDRLLVEPLAFAARSAYRKTAEPPVAIRSKDGRIRFAWFAADDPLPFVAMALRQLWWSVRLRLPLRRTGDPNKPKT